MCFCNDFSLVWNVELGATKMEEEWRGHCPSKLFKILPRKAGKMMNGHSQEAGTLTSNFPALLSHLIHPYLNQVWERKGRERIFILQ